MTYSDTWFETFLRGVPSEQTSREVAFLARCVPLPDYSRVLDLCCGLGRHAAGLARGGYDVVGVDRDPAIVADAEVVEPGNPRYLIGDAREVGSFDLEIDAVIIMWASFGYFDAPENDAVLRSLAKLLRPKGRLILDLYHRGFFEDHQGETTREIRGTRLTETRQVVDGRLSVSLAYANGDRDTFEWELFSPAEISRRAGSAGFETVGVWSRFDPTQDADPSEGRFQILLEKC